MGRDWIVEASSSKIKKYGKGKYYTWYSGHRFWNIESPVHRGPDGDKLDRWSAVYRAGGQRNEICSGLSAGGPMAKRA